jgi:hypothetical protein
MQEMKEKFVKGEMDDKKLKKELLAFNKELKNGENKLPSLAGIAIYCDAYKDAVTRVILEELKASDLTPFRKEVKKKRWQDTEHDFSLYLMDRAFFLFGPAISIAFHGNEFMKELKAIAEEIYQPGNYGLTVQGTLTNQTRQVGKKPAPGAEAGDLMSYQGEKVKLVFLESKSFGGVAMTAVMHKVLAMSFEELCRILPAGGWQGLAKKKVEELDKYTGVTVSLSEYMRLTGTKDEKTARTAIKNACERLTRVMFSVKVQNRIIQGYYFTKWEYKRGGQIKLFFSTDFIKYCANTSPAYFHRSLYLVNGNNNPYAINIYFKLWQHFMQMRGKTGGGRLLVENIISSVPDIPTYEEVMEGNRVVHQRIIRPFERDMEALVELGAVLSWHYSNEAKERVTSEQVAGMDYEEWRGLYVSFELDLPDQTPYIEAHRERAEKAKISPPRRKRGVAMCQDKKSKTAPAPVS